VVDFQYSGLQITKVKINCFFLDQTRLVSPNQNEQNYHIFYQMLTGLSPEERSKYYLDYHDTRTFQYLSQGQEPKDSPQHLQNHFEAWKVSEGVYRWLMKERQHRSLIWLCVEELPTYFKLQACNSQHAHTRSGESVGQQNLGSADC